MQKAGLDSTLSAGPPRIKPAEPDREDVEIR